jgi:hypothetical protein
VQGRTTQSQQNRRALSMRSNAEERPFAFQKILIIFFGDSYPVDSIDHWFYNRTSKG